MAVAMEDTILTPVSSKEFIAHLNNHSLVEDFVRYLVNRVAEQDRFIANLITVDCEHRLGQTLLLLARKIGEFDARRAFIKHKITHEELSEMVGTTRPRITQFLNKFRGLGLIQITPEHLMIIDEKKLTDYLALG
jgi:CRP-like cAMP-binding protein